MYIEDMRCQTRGEQHKMAHTHIHTRTKQDAKQKRKAYSRITMCNFEVLEVA